MIAQRLAENAPARMELGWLRAKEKADEDAARALERLDPQIKHRLRESGADIDEHVEEAPRERRARFGRLWDECYRRHALALWREP